ncbi:hypothetical protein GW17_00020491 [Ensete ventricosum]|nr:hypothetical protein GW17_00020491 [Ensete ventricosum]
MASVSSLPAFAFAISDYRTHRCVLARSRSTPTSGISGPGSGLDSLGRAAASCRRLNPWHRRGDWSLRPVRAESSEVKKTEREPMVPPYNVLITVERVESAIQSLRKEFGEHRVWVPTVEILLFLFLPLPHL